VDAGCPTSWALLLHPRRGFVTAPQDRVVKIGRMCFARIKGHNDPLVPRIDFYVAHTFDFHEWPAELSGSAMMILAFSRDFDRFQDRVIRAFREKRIGWIGIIWSCRVHRFYLFNVRHRSGGCLLRYR
jgi:hypothetical protein